MDLTKILKMDNSGQMNITGMGVGAIVGVLVIVIFVNIWNSLNKELIDGGTLSMINLIPLAIAAVLLIAIVGSLAFNRR